MAERLERWTCYSEAPSSSLTLTASWIRSRSSRVQILVRVYLKKYPTDLPSASRVS